MKYANDTNAKCNCNLTQFNYSCGNNPSSSNGYYLLATKVTDSCAMTYFKLSCAQLHVSLSFVTFQVTNKSRIILKIAMSQYK